MASRHDPALAVGAVFSRATRLFRASFFPCLVPAAAYALLDAFISARALPDLDVQSFSMEDLDVDALMRYSGELMRPSVMWVSLGLWVALTWAVGATLLQQWHLLRSQRPALLDSAFTALRWAPAALLAAVLYVLVCAVGCMALLVPGVYLSGALALWPAAMFTERLGPVDALLRSSRVMRGHWWQVNIAITVAVLLTWLASAVLQALANGVLSQIVAVLSVMFSLPWLTAVLLTLWSALEAPSGSKIAP